MEAQTFVVLPSGTVTSPQGFSAGSVYAGIKTPKPDVRDMSILASAVPCAAAGVFTRNKVRAAPVTVSEDHLADGRAQALVVNSGVANACTGEQGLEDAREMAKLTAKKLGLAAGDVLVASTGVIGHLLPLDKISAGIAEIRLSDAGGHDFSRGILTTDSHSKEIAVKVNLSNSTITIGGTTKGAAMMHPNMATMLAFVTTDAAAQSPFLKKALRAAADLSFNMMTVDCDTSTNDSLFLLANGLAGNQAIDENSPDAAAFQSALTYVCTYLAKEIARDGEGATKLIEINVEGASSDGDARLMARTIVGSPLLKAAVHGNDPNWGRIMMAAGRSGAEMVEAKTDVFIGDIQLMQGGRPLPYDEKVAAKALDRPEVFIRVHLNLGPCKATAWGCDLSEEYVTLNSDYTT